MFRKRYLAAIAAGVLAGGVLAGTGSANATSFSSFIGPLHHTSVLATTVPGNGDVNPYGVAVVPRSAGDLFAGNVLVSNFNNKANAQGTGTTIVEPVPCVFALLLKLLTRTSPACRRPVLCGTTATP